MATFDSFIIQQCMIIMPSLSSEANTLNPWDQNHKEIFTSPIHRNKAWSHSIHSTVWYLQVVMCSHCVFAAAFDRQYMAAYERLPERDLKLYQQCDKPPSIASLYCRHYFKELELWHDMNCLDAVSTFCWMHTQDWDYSMVEMSFRRCCLWNFCTQFLGAFAKLPKVTISFVKSVFQFLCIEQLFFHWMDFHEIWYLSIF